MSAVVTAVIVVLILSLFFHRNIVSTRTYTVQLALAPEDAITEIESYFMRVAWANAAGPGLINKARVSKGTPALVVSVDIIEQVKGEAAAGGETEDTVGRTHAQVRVWISNRAALAGLTFSNGALKAAQIRARLRRHPAFIREEK